MRYFNLIKNTIVTSMVLLLMVLSLISCEKREEYYGTSNGYSETIGFRIIDHNVQTRNTLAVIDNEKIVNKFILRSEDGMDSLHLTQYESDINAPFNIQTRAGVFNDLSDGFFVYGYNFNNTSTATLFIDNKKAIISDSKWAFSPSEYWPSGESQFFCYANAPTSGFSISTEKGAPKMTYTMPSSLADHKDIVVARSNRYPANTESVPLTFEHPLTSVEFKIGTVGMPGTINKVTISGIYTTGKLNLGHPSESFQVMGAWTYPSSKANFSQDVQISLTEDKNGKDIATLDNNYAFMMVPQTLDGAKLTINYTYEGKTKDLDAKLIGTWSPGKRVTYTLTTKDILDIWFNNTTEICLDAHYVMSEVLDIHIGKNVGEWTLTSDADWLKFQTKDWNDVKTYNLHDLQEDGWWIGEFFYGGTVNDTKISAIAKNTITLSLNDIDRKIVLVATENAGETDRKAKVTLSAGSTEDGTFISIPIIITQMHPYWNGNIGSERIEEYPDGYESGVPWGPYWEYTGDEDTPNYTVRYPTSGFNSIDDHFWAWLWQLLAGKNNVTEEKDKYIGLITTAYIFNYNNVVSTVVAGTNSPTDGLFNTSNGYSTAVMATDEFRDWLESQGVTPSGATFKDHDFTNSALLSALKKNKIKLGVRSSGNDVGYFADTDATKSAGDIVWYLPAKDEATTGVYYENADKHSCETSFGNGTFWTSTSLDGEHAYTYNFKDNSSTSAPVKSQFYRVRAVRHK